MIFLTTWFWVFFAAVAAAIALVPHRGARLNLLLAASVWFQLHFAGRSAFAVIIALMLLTYFAGTRYAVTGRRGWISSAIVINVLALAFFKYLNFLVASAFHLAGVFASGLPDAPRYAIAAPLGVSFFVFEFVHYLVEVERGMPPARSFRNFWIFAAYFPCMVSGPIKRFPAFNAQLEEGPRQSLGGVASGLSRVIVGAFKKVVIAEACHGFAVHFEANPGAHPLILLILALSFQIYFDFAGYSDIAIGASHMLGLDVPENFNNPYAAANISDFWRRWHMSLSSWIRDYLYIPLGGNRVSKPRRVFNGLLAMFICGLWHGPALRFGLWGLWHGALLGLHSAVGPRMEPERPGLGARAAALAYRAFTLAAVGVGWLLFFYEPAKIAELARGAHGVFW